MDLSNRRRGEQGSTLVETAIVLPLGMALLLGVITGGTAYYEKINLADATRGGVRFGASLKVAAGGVPAWRQAVRQRVAELSGGEVAAADVCADLVRPTGSDASCGVADPIGAETDPTAEEPASVVKVSVSKPTTVDFIFFSSRPTLSAKVAARYERDVT